LLRRLLLLSPCVSLDLDAVKATLKLVESVLEGFNLRSTVGRQGIDLGAQ